MFRLSADVDIDINMDMDIDIDVAKERHTCPGADLHPCSGYPWAMGSYR